MHFDCSSPSNLSLTLVFFLLFYCFRYLQMTLQSLNKCFLLLRWYEQNVNNILFFISPNSQLWLKKKWQLIKCMVVTKATLLIHWLEIWLGFLRWKQVCDTLIFLTHSKATAALGGHLILLGDLTTGEEEVPRDWRLMMSVMETEYPQRLPSQ